MKRRAAAEANALHGSTSGRITFTPFRELFSEPRHDVLFAPAFTHDTFIVDLAAAEERILAGLDGVVYDGIHNVINAAPLLDIYSEPFRDPAKEEIARRFQEANGGTMRDARKWTMHADNYSFKGWDNANGRDYSSARIYTQFREFRRYSEADIEFTHRMYSHADALHEHDNTIELTPGKDYRPGESRERPATIEDMMQSPGPLLLVRMDGEGNVVDVPGVRVFKEKANETKAGYIRKLKQHGYQWVADALSVNIYTCNPDEPPVILITREEWDAADD